MEIGKTYNLIGSKTNGVLVFKYNLNGVLIDFQLQDCDKMNEKQINWFFTPDRFPYLEHQIKNFQAVREFTVTEGELEITFEMFWNAYKYKVKRMQAEKAWEKLSESDQLKAIAGIRHYDGYLQRKRGIDKAHPGSYLNQKYFNDEWGSAT